MRPEFVGIERRLARLSECLQKLEPLRDRTLNDFLTEPSGTRCMTQTANSILYSASFDMRLHSC